MKCDEYEMFSWTEEDWVDHFKRLKVGLEMKQAFDNLNDEGK